MKRERNVVCRHRGTDSARDYIGKEGQASKFLWSVVELGGWNEGGGGGGRGNEGVSACASGDRYG